MSGDKSTFDADTFLATETTETMATKFDPVPEGEYVASIDDVKVRAAKDSVILDVNWLVLDDALKQKMNMEKVVVRQSIFLDVDEGGRLQIGPNKNVRLGRLRESLGQNKPGQAWSFRSLKGAGPVKIVVTQREVTKEGSTETDTYNDVAKVLPLS